MFIGGGLLIVAVGLLVFIYRYRKGRSLGKYIWYIIVALIGWYVGMLFARPGV